MIKGEHDDDDDRDTYTTIQTRWDFTRTKKKTGYVIIGVWYMQISGAGEF